jgi:FixJ family two-component response regulator
MNHPKEQYLIRVLDDDEEFLDAIGFLLETEGWRVRTFSDADDLYENTEDRTPGCLILDVNMPKASGPEVLSALKERKCPLPVIILTGHGQLDLAVKVFRSGACDFLSKPVTKDDLVRSVERAVVLGDEERERAYEHSPEALFESLTAREKQIVVDIGNFLSAKLIAERHGISERTAETHRARVMKKLKLHKPAEVRAFLRDLKK